MAKTKDSKGVGSIEEIRALNDEELMEEWTSLGERVQRDKELLKEFSREHQSRERLKQLNLTAADLELLQDTSPEYIESQEQVN